MKMSDTDSFKGEWNVPYKCDNCKSEFLGRDIELEADKPVGCEILIPIYRRLGVMYNDITYNFKCPECKAIHLHGFERVG